MSRPFERLRKEVLVDNPWHRYCRDVYTQADTSEGNYYYIDIPGSAATIPLFAERKEAIVANCQANIGQIVDLATGLDATVILTTVFPVGKVPLARRPFWSKNVPLAVDEVNPRIPTCTLFEDRVEWATLIEPTERGARPYADHRCRHPHLSHRG